MPAFKYTVKDDSGQTIEGIRTAGNPRSVASELRNEGFFIIRIEEHKEKVKKGTLFEKKPSSRDFMVFCRQFATAIEAGMNVSDALRILARQSSPSLGAKITQVILSLERGRTLTDALVEHDSYFPPIMVSMIEAGELGGVLDVVMIRLADHFEKEHDLREKIKSASTYPVVILSIATLVLIFLIVKVLPTFGGIFDSLDADLPWITLTLLGFSDFLQKTWYVMLLAVLLILFIIRQSLHNEKGAENFDRLKLKLPIFGPIYKKIILARFSRTLSTLLASGVDIISTLLLLGRVVNNRIMQSAINKSAESIRQGQSMSTPLRTSGLFPTMLTEMMQIGEETGSIDEMMSKLADFYESDVSYTVARISSVIEPVMILCVALVVGLIAAAIVTPMFEMFQHVM
ncbi:MAG: type II secretion system F family protein [Dethiobacter sp.]|jgi:type IV pilus assembly protein PilC|nr:type II secretion system F family protein [Dethiobacter sp.]